MRRTLSIAVAALAAIGTSTAPAVLAAQDTLRLAELHEAAIGRDARARQLALHRSATDLRLRNLGASWLPRLSAGADATYQSEVPRIPVAIPGSAPSPPPQDRYAATVSVEQLILDGGSVRLGRALERTRLSVTDAQLAAELHPLRSEVNEAFFSAFLLQERLAEIDALAEDLEARLAVLRAQAREGAALPGDTAAVLAELLRAEQQRSEAEAGRRAALAVLRDLTERPVGESDLLALPDLAAQVERVRADMAQSEDARAGEHPQYAVFAAQREQLDRESALIAARERPRITGFGQLGYGRPGLELFTDDLHEYWTAGVRLQWQPWTWGTGAREREVLRIQQRILETSEAAFADRLRRQVRDELEIMERLRATLELDERIIALREQVERQARAQLDERAITTAAYVTLRTDLQEARLARQRHRVELSRARAAFLTTLGIELR